MATLSLAQAKSALNATRAQGGEAKAVYHGPGSWAIPNTPVKKDAEKHDAKLFAPAAKKEESHVSAVEERHATPIFVPMDMQSGVGHDGKPVHVLDITTRGDVVNGQFKIYSENIYRNYMLMLACIVLTFASVFVSIYIAALFAYLSGHFHSERMAANSWEIEWWKGKSVVHTK